MVRVIVSDFKSLVINIIRTKRATDGEWENLDSMFEDWVKGYQQGKNQMLQTDNKQVLKKPSASMPEASAEDEVEQPKGGRGSSSGVQHMDSKKQVDGMVGKLSKVSQILHGLKKTTRKSELSKAFLNRLQEVIKQTEQQRKVAISLGGKSDEKERKGYMKEVAKLLQEVKEMRATAKAFRA